MAQSRTGNKDFSRRATHLNLQNDGALHLVQQHLRVWQLLFADQDLGAQLILVRAAAQVIH